MPVDVGVVADWLPGLMRPGTASLNVVSRNLFFVLKDISVLGIIDQLEFP